MENNWGLATVMWIRMNYNTNPDPGSGKFSIGSKSGSGNSPYGSKEKNPISIFLHIYRYCICPGSGFVSLHTDPDPTFIKQLQSGTTNLDPDPNRWLPVVGNHWRLQKRKIFLTPLKVQDFIFAFCRCSYTYFRTSCINVPYHRYLFRRAKKLQALPRKARGKIWCVDADNNDACPRY